jgi:hypothetical protein
MKADPGDTGRFIGKPPPMAYPVRIEWPAAGTREDETHPLALPLKGLQGGSREGEGPPRGSGLDLREAVALAAGTYREGAADGEGPGLQVDVVPLEAE